LAKNQPVHAKSEHAHHGAWQYADDYGRKSDGHEPTPVQGEAEREHEYAKDDETTPTSKLAPQPFGLSSD